MNNKVSIIIPTYNREKYVCNSILSAMNQTCQNIEIIVVDDGSSDNTQQILEKIKDKRVKYIKLDKNGGAQNARNIGISRASGEYFVFLDSDVELLPDYTARALKVFENNSNCSVTVCGYNLLDKDRRIIRSYLPGKNITGNIHRYVVDRLIVSDTNSFMFKKECFEDVRFDERLPSWQEDDVIMKISKNKEFERVPDILLNIIEHDLPRISDNAGRYAKGHYVLIEIHKDEIVRVAGNKTLSYHYLDAAIDYLFASDMKMFLELCGRSDHYYKLNLAIKGVRIMKKTFIRIAKGIYFNMKRRPVRPGTGII